MFDPDNPYYDDDSQIRFTDLRSVLESDFDYEEDYSYDDEYEELYDDCYA